MAGGGCYRTNCETEGGLACKLRLLRVIVC